MSNRNQAIIEEFRANAGKVGGHFANMPLLLLHTRGAQSGKPRVNPLAYVMDGERIVVIASKGGSDTHPDWYHNVKKHPQVTVELGSEKFEARATPLAKGPEHERLYALMAERNPIFAQYQRKAKRTIPVVVLERV